MYKFLLLPIILVLSISASAQNYVTLYEDCNYSGPSYYLEPGNHRLYQMKIGNDRLSSIQIPYGFRITVYMDDNFGGNSKTFTSSVACLSAEWNDNTSSIVVENTLSGNYSQNDYITFYNNSNYGGYSQSLRPGSYTGAQLGALRYNISSFKISGNLQVKVYVNNENLSGYNNVYTESQSYLPSNVNDKIGSLIIETKTTQPVNTGNSNSYATFYSECSYDGNALRLMPGYYSGEKLGVLKYSIASVQIPSTLRVKAFINNDNLYGQSTELTGNYSCLDYNLKNKIGSLVVEERGYGNNNNYPPAVNDKVIIYTDTDYKGQSVSLLPGTYSTMAQINFPDNALSSLTVPVGYRVVIYEFENFGGKEYTITDSKPKFYLSGWNDKTSSIAVYRDR